MSIHVLDFPNHHIFGFEVKGKLTDEDCEALLPQIEASIPPADHKLRLLVQVKDMEGAELASEWEIFSFLRHHVNDLELIAIVGAHSWTEIMSKVLAASVFVEAETRYFEANEYDDACLWLKTAAHPTHVPIRKVISSDDGLFTKYSSPNYM
jgi:hypothetical protein